MSIPIMLHILAIFSSLQQYERQANHLGKIQKPSGLVSEIVAALGHINN